MFVSVFHTQVLPVTKESEPPRKTVNMFMYNSQEMSETLFLPPLFLVLSAD